MSNTINEGSGDDMLTAEEEARFDQLFAETDRLTLGHDWVEAFLEEVQTPGYDGAAAVPVGPARTDDEIPMAPVVDVDHKRRARVPVLAVAAAILIAVAIGASLLFASGGTSTGGFEEIPVLDAPREVEPPDVQSLPLPEGSTELVELRGGQTIAFAQLDGGEETALHLSSDLVSWDELATLPIVDAVADFTTDTWYVAGGDADSIMQFGLGETSREATELAVYQSTDSGMTWEAIELNINSANNSVETGQVTGLPFTERHPHSFSIAALDDTVLVGYEIDPITDWTALAQEFDLVDGNTAVVRIDGFLDNFWAVGPDRFEQLEIGGIDVGVGRDEFNELAFSGATVVARSVGGEPFELVEIPVEDQFNEIIWSPVLSTHEGEFLVTNPPYGFDSNAITSPDGLGWEVRDDGFLEQIELNTNSVSIVNRADWEVRLRRDGNDVLAEQRAAAQGNFTLVPRPEVQAAVQIGFETDFGGAVVWQDNDANSLASVRSIAESDGYTFELFDNFTVGVTAPDGTVVSERQSLSGMPVDRILLDGYGTIRLYDDDGSVRVSIEASEFTDAFYTSGIRAERPPARFISWATNPDDWRFAELEGLSAVIWNFQELEQGLLATAAHDPSEAVLIQWPDQFGE